jgi:hypothetical protein
MLVATLAIAASFGKKMGPVAEINEGLFAGVCLKEDASSTPPVAAVGAAFGNKLFPQKTHTAVSAISSFDKKFDLIDKRHFPSFLSFFYPRPHAGGDTQSGDLLLM